MIESSNSCEYIYLNNAATSFPKPDCVAAAMADAVSTIPGGDNRGSFETRNVIEELREALAKLLHVDTPERIALGPNATWGLNAAIFGANLQPGDCAITTCAEHNSTLRPLYALEQKGVRVVYVPVEADGHVSASAWESAIAANSPKLATFMHASNVTGAINDIKTLAAIAKRAGCITIVDAAQTLGLIDIDASNPDIDMVAFTGHKYLLGPQGTGGLFVSKGVELTPHSVGGTGAKSDLKEMPTDYPLHLEAGTGNEPSNAGLLAAIQWAAANPADLADLEAKTARIREGLKDAGANVIEVSGPSTPVVSFAVDGLSVTHVGDLLLDCYDIVCRTGLHCAPMIFEHLGEGFENGTVRISLSRFTTDEEIDELLEGIEDIISSETEF